ncbi:MAG: ABC transporter permease [Hyphomicrobiales bacterium]|nr:ABC transporter permease [Hyphomicrobiales bacterium]
MWAYVANRIGLAAVVVLIALSVNFAIPRIMPGDPVEQQLAAISAAGGQTGDMAEAAKALRQRFQLDRPIWEQYLGYLWNVARADLGVSVANYPQRVSEIVLSGLPWTVGLLGLSTLISFGLGTLTGALMAWPSAPRALRLLALPLVLVSAIPYFVIGLVLLALLGIVWPILPVAGGYPFGQVMNADLPTALGVLKHGILPALSIVLASLGAWALAMRGMVVSVLGEDYMMLAEAKGLTERRIFLAYGVRNALLPQFTQLALKLGALVSGAILVEVIFAYPGIGYKLYVAIGQKDVFVVQGIVLLLSLSIAAAMLILDLFYPLIDPRVAARSS